MRVNYSLCYNFMLTTHYTPRVYGIYHIYTIPQAYLEKLGVTGLYPKTGFTEENLKLYLQNPPSGLHTVQYSYIAVEIVYTHIYTLHMGWIVGVVLMVSIYDERHSSTYIKAD